MTKPKTCEGCPLYESGKGFVRPTVIANSYKLLVLGEAPGRNEVEEGLPFVGASGHWLRRNVLENCGLREDECVFDNTIRCLLGNKSGGYPTGKDRIAAEEQCRQYDVWAQFPNVPLLLVGAKAIGQYMLDDRVSRWHGNVVFREGRAIMGTYHPAAILRNPNLLPLVVQEVRNLLKASNQPSLLALPKVHKGYIP